MEDPATWGPVEKIIDRVMEDHARARAEEPGLCGLSLARQIADALRKEGLLKDA